MGILGLSKLIADVAPSAIKENEFKNYFGRRIAVDASMSLYQFLIAVRQQSTDGAGGGGGMSQLTSSDGETTSHLMGFFYRTIRMAENGIKPVYVFDGKPPSLKSGELDKRTERRAVAEKALEVATESGDAVEMDKQARRLVKVGKQHVDEAQKLLTLMGVPFINAPCEAEAQCAWLCKTGGVYGVATEDMDALTFGTTVLLRHLTFSEARKMNIKEFHLNRVLQEANLSMDMFIDLCILMGCDYCDSIRGIGPKRAFELITKHKSIEVILEQIDKSKYGVPENWAFKEARRLFTHPDVDTAVQVNWNAPGDEDKLVQFLAHEKGFAEDRVRNGWRKLTKARGKATQARLDSFFTVTNTTTAAAKRPPADDSKNKSKKQKTSSNSGGGRKRGK